MANVIEGDVEPARTPAVFSIPTVTVPGLPPALMLDGGAGSKTSVAGELEATM
jgi:hypothetical protein